MKKFLLIPFLSLYACVINFELFAAMTAGPSEVNAYIKNIKNLALCKIYLTKKENESNLVVDSNSTVPVSIKIPFVSVNKYMTQFVKNIPYAPKKSLKVVTKNGVYLIWASESGIVCAPDPKDFDNLGDWKSKILFSLDRDQEINPLRFAMQIDKNGKISLGKFTS